VALVVAAWAGWLERASAKVTTKAAAAPAASVRLARVAGLRAVEIGIEGMSGI
jgi:hypothetical protein